MILSQITALEAAKNDLLFYIIERPTFVSYLYLNTPLDKLFTLIDTVHLGVLTHIAPQLYLTFHSMC